MLQPKPKTEPNKYSDLYFNLQQKKTPPTFFLNMRQVNYSLPGGMPEISHKFFSSFLLSCLNYLCRIRFLEAFRARDEAALAVVGVLEQGVAGDAGPQDAPSSRIVLALFLSV